MMNKTLTARVAKVEGALRGIRDFANQYLSPNTVEAIQDDDDLAAEATHKGDLNPNRIEASTAGPRKKASKLESEASQGELAPELESEADDNELPQGLAASEFEDDFREPASASPVIRAKHGTRAPANPLGEIVNPIGPIRCAFANRWYLFEGLGSYTRHQRRPQWPSLHQSRPQDQEKTERPACS